MRGTKTQTRRVILPQPEERGEGFWFWRGGKALERAGYGASYVHTNWDAVVRAMLAVCPHGKAGDMLWGREALVYADGCWRYEAERAEVCLSADDPRVPEMLSWAHHRESDRCSGRHMPKFASRLTVELTDVRVEQLQDISEEDALAEGISGPHDVGYPAFRVPGDSKPRFSSARAAFEVLWDAINGKRAGCAWADNPRVYAESFRRVDAGKAAA